MLPGAHAPHLRLGRTSDSSRSSRAAPPVRCAYAPARQGRSGPNDLRRAGASRGSGEETPSVFPERPYLPTYVTYPRLFWIVTTNIVVSRLCFALRPVATHSNTRPCSRGTSGGHVTRYFRWRLARVLPSIARASRLVLRFCATVAAVVVVDEPHALASTAVASTASSAPPKRSRRRTRPSARERAHAVVGMPRRLIAARGGEVKKMLDSPGATLSEVMLRVTVYSTDPCSFCRRVKGLLEARGVEFSEINLAKDP